jgi:site-specific DNA-methyltransferase (adenine-specific)
MTAPWKRRVVIGDCTIYEGDCMAVMPTLGKVDAVITDPPYGANTHKMAKTNKGAGHGVRHVLFAPLTGEGFSAVAAACLLASDGWVIMTCDLHHAALTYALPEFVRLGAWVKPNPMPSISADRPSQGFETVVILHSGRRKKAWNRGGGSGVWTFPVHSGALVPTQKPIKLIRAFVEDFTNAGETVLDPFAGSGTTGAACVSAGRKFIGIEKDFRHFDIACKRIADAYAQPDMFVAAPAAKPEQLDMMEPDA